MHKITHQEAGPKISFLWTPKDVLDEIWQLISSQLEDLKDLMALRGTNKHLYAVCLNTSQWQAFLEKWFPAALACAPSDRNYPKLYQEHVLQHCHLQKLSCRTFIDEWDNFHTDGNLLFISKSNSDNSLISAVKVWNIFTGKLLYTLQDGNPNTPCQVKGDSLFCRGADRRMIQIWDIRKGELIRAFNQGRGIFCFRVEGNFLFTSAEDGIKVWDILTGDLIRTLGQKGDIPVSSFQVHGDLLATVSFGDTSVRIWELSTGALVHEFEDTDRIAQFRVQGNLLFTGSHRGIARVRDISTGELIYTFKHEEGDKIKYLKIRKNLLFTGSLCGVKIWDLGTGKLIRALAGREAICLHFRVKQDLFFTTSYSKTEIKNIHTGELVCSLKNNSHDRSSSMCVKEDFLFVGYYNYIGQRKKSVEVWDLLPNPSIYEWKSLQDSLNILGQMAHAAYHHNRNELQPLFEELHPNFQWYLHRYCLTLTGEKGNFCSEGILRVQTMVCLEMLLHVIHGQERANTLPLLEQLTFINEAIPNTLYGLLYNQCTPITTDPQWGEHAFKGMQGVQVSRKERIKAVEALQASLMEEWKTPSNEWIDAPVQVEDVPAAFEELKGPENSLLVGLGVITRQEYSEKLGCSPDFLSTVGILSSADLELLGANHCPMDSLKLPELTTVDSKDRQVLQSLAFEKKTALSTCLHQLSEVAEENEKSDLYVVAQNPWNSFHEKVKQFFSGMQECCRNQSGLIAFFQPESHVKAVQGLNGLIEEFNALNQEYQVKKLHSYLSQYGLLRAWTNLRAQGISSLSAFVEISKMDLFRMGE